MAKVKQTVVIEKEVERIPMIAPSLRDMAALEKVVTGYMTERETKEYVDEDWDEWMAEALLEYFYGKDVWEYLKQFYG